MRIASIEKRVQNGIKWLDKEVPDWKVDVGLLDQRLCTVCVLGQVLGGYYQFVGASGRLTQTQAEDRGFHAYDCGSDNEWELLTETWKDALEKERGRILEKRGGHGNDIHSSGS